MSQGLAHRLVFEQDGKLFRPVGVEDISTHLEKVLRLARLGDPESLGLAVSVPALVDGPIGKALLQVLTNRVEAGSIDLWHVAEDSRACRVWHAKLRGTVRKFTNEAMRAQIAVGCCDHWVPGANDTLTAICQEWAKKENVELKIDYITSQGNKIMMTATAESQAQSGHDILQFLAWYPLSLAKSLEPVDDVMGGLLAHNGKVSPAIEYLGRSQGHWLGVPAVTGTQVKPPCARIDLLKSQCGIDVQAMYPAGKPPTKEADNWNWDNFVVAAEKAFKAGNPFGLGLGQTTDSVDWVGSLFASYGAQLVDAKGNITVKSDAVKRVLEYSQ